MTESPVSLQVADLNTFTRSLSRQLGETRSSYLTLMNIIARAGGFRNIQHMRASSSARGGWKGITLASLLTLAPWSAGYTGSTRWPGYVTGGKGRGANFGALGRVGDTACQRDTEGTRDERDAHARAQLPRPCHPSANDDLVRSSHAAD